MRGCVKMLKKLMTGVLVIALLSGLAGCGTVTDALVVEAVKNAYFDGYADKTIGECFDWFSSTSEISLNWFAESKNNAPEGITLGASEKIVVCQIADNGYASNYGFSYDTKSKVTTPLYAQSIGPDDEVLQELTDKAELDDMYGYLVQLIQYSDGMAFDFEDESDLGEYDLGEYDLDESDLGELDPSELAPTE